MRHFILLPFLCQVTLGLDTYDSATLPAMTANEVRSAFGEANRFVVPSSGSSTTWTLPDHSDQRPRHWKGKDGGGARTLTVEASRGAATATCWGNRSAPVTLLTLAVGLSDTYMALLRWNRLAYAMQHGLEYCEYTQAIDPKREPTWSKISAILYLLEDPAGPRSRVQWLDADILIMNPNISIIKDVLGPLASKDAVFSADFPASRGQVRSRINAGSMHLRNSPWTRAILKHLFSTPAGTRSTVLALIDGSYDCEQTALMQARAENPAEFDAHTATVPWNAMNTLGIPNYCEGDFVVHAAGGGSRLGSFFFGEYGSKWGGPDKYRQLEEFMFHVEAQKVGQRLRGNPSGSETRCGEFVPHDGTENFMVVRHACFVLAVAGFAAAAWSTISRTAKALCPEKAGFSSALQGFV